MRPWIAIGLVIAAFVPGRAGASCAAPWVEVPQTVNAGDPVSVEGEFFINGCNDTGGGNVCNPFPEPQEPEFPMTDVRLELRHDGKVLDAVVVDADSEGRLHADLELPADAETGRYLVDVVYDGFRQQRTAVEVVGR